MRTAAPPPPQIRTWELPVPSYIAPIHMLLSGWLAFGWKAFLCWKLFWNKYFDLSTRGCSMLMVLNFFTKWTNANLDILQFERIISDFSRWTVIWLQVRSIVYYPSKDVLPKSICIDEHHNAWDCGSRKPGHQAFRVALIVLSRKADICVFLIKREQSIYTHVLAKRIMGEIIAF